MELLFENIYFLSFYGFLIYSVGVFVIKKDKYENENKKLLIKKYLFDNWDNWIFSLMLVPIIAIKAEDMWAILMEVVEKKWIFYKVYYLGVGIIVEAFYILIEWVNNKRKKLIKQ